MADPAMVAMIAQTVAKDRADREDKIRSELVGGMFQLALGYGLGELAEGGSGGANPVEAGEATAAPATEAAEALSLRRPHIRKAVVVEVEARAPRAADGRYLDANTGEPIDGKYDLGHKPGHEFWREKAKADVERLTQGQFNDRMNNPDLYQIENPSSNRSHRFQQPQ